MKYSEAPMSNACARKMAFFSLIKTYSTLNNCPRFFCNVFCFEIFRDNGGKCNQNKDFFAQRTNLFNCSTSCSLQTNKHHNPRYCQTKNAPVTVVVVVVTVVVVTVVVVAVITDGGTAIA